MIPAIISDYIYVHKLKDLGEGDGQFICKRGFIVCVILRVFHRHIRKIDWLMARTDCLFVSLALLVAAAKKAKNVVLVAGT
jgi:hypothetical protein